MVAIRPDARAGMQTMHVGSACDACRRSLLQEGREDPAQGLEAGRLATSTALTPMLRPLAQRLVQASATCSTAHGRAPPSRSGRGSRAARRS